MPKPMEFSEQERAKAAERICIRGEQAGRETFERHPGLAYDIALVTQMELDRAEAQIAVARDLFTALDGLPYGIWWVARKNWLEANKPEEGSQ
jgi:hypothetical protein